MTSPQIYEDYGSFYLVQDLKGLSEYDKAKAITKFVNKGTKMLEMYLDSELEKIFIDNFILIKNTDKESIKKAFTELRSLGKRIEILDLFSGKDFDRCKHITTTKGNMTIVLEDERYLQCGIKINEVAI